MARPTSTTPATPPPADLPADEDQSKPGGTSLTPLDVQRQVAEAAAATRPAFVSEGVRQELLGGGRAFDHLTQRELTLEGYEPASDGQAEKPGLVRFKTDAEIAADPPPGTITTADVASLNPS